MYPYTIASYPGKYALSPITKLIIIYLFPNYYNFYLFVSYEIVTKFHIWPMIVFILVQSSIFHFIFRGFVL